MANNDQIQEINSIRTRGAFIPETYNRENHTIDVVFATERAVRAIDYNTWTRITETLICTEEAVDLARMKAGAPFLKDHRNGTDHVIGTCVDAWVKDGKVYGRFRLSKTPNHKDIIDNIIDGILKNISVGYDVREYTKYPSVDNNLPEWHATKWEPAEASLVGVPADFDSQVRSLTPEERMQKPTIPTGGNVPDPALATPAADTQVDVTTIRTEAELAGRTRAEDILSTVLRAKLEPALAQEWIKEGITADVARQRVLAKLTEGDQGISTRNQPDVKNKVDERDKIREAAAIGQALRSGAILEGDLSKDEIEMARPHRRTKLTRLAEDCVLREDSGFDVRGVDEMELSKRAITSSTGDFPVIMEAVLNRVLLKAYKKQPFTWRRFCSVGSATDFRDYKILRPGSFTNLDTVGENGEFKTKKIPDASYEKYAIDTKGNIINLSRQAIINDDLGAFTRLARDLGHAAARSIEQDVYNMLLENAGLGPVMVDTKTLFHADHGNIATGAAPSVTAFDAMRTKMRVQKDESGNDYLDLNPAIGLFPVSLKGAVDVINNSEYNTEVSNKFQVPNMVRGLLREVVDSPRLTGTRYWFFADPDDYPTLQVAFLNGVQTPFTDRKEGFHVDGVEWKIRLDYGVAAIGIKGALTNAGA